jgi:hypothetical protein
VSDGFAHIQGGGTLANMPPAVRARIDPEGIARIEQYERVRASGGGAVQTDQRRYYALARMAAEQPLEFARLNLTEELASLSQSDFQSLVNDQNQIKAGRPADLARQQQLVAAVTGPVLQQVGIMRPVSGAPTRSQVADGQEERAELFQTAIFNEVQAFRRDNGRDPSVEDVQNMTDRLLVQTTVQVPGRVFGNYWPNQRQRFAFEMPPPAAAAAPEPADDEPIPEAPRDVTMREVGRIYSTAIGLARWRGNGWEPIN